MALTKPTQKQFTSDIVRFDDPVFAANYAHTGTNVNDVGFIFNRGSDINVGFIWDESADEFAAITTTDTGDTTGNIAISSYATFKVGQIVANGIAFPASDGTDGLVLHLDAGNSLSYPGTGTTWYDISGNGNNGTMAASNPVFNSNGSSSSFTFDGSFSAFTVDATSINFSTEQTIIMFLKPEEADANRRNPYNQAYGGYGTITHESAGGFNYYHGTNGGNASPYQGTGSTFQVGNNEIAMIGLVRDSSYIKWYKNGSFSNQLVNSYPTASSSVNTITIGDGYVDGWLGKIYLSLLYDRALSANEIQQNYNALRERFGL